ncbi:aminotransferase class I/II-fold pyridoxal phosphate-dependent enzyme [Xenorhabdus nematophila]|uniref:DegT/DnrJ/EryC1/StrS family aminotransferase n=1 Tax=Xenorhabdus nematophila TaxID=628 RepID=UPI0003275B58|nr:aminotransferase class I/II-fold pyridoxal phosphate-dependent enzyme [Xenorhabdus nematophila]CEF32244.1 putative Aminotransferase [Xenorhabdus nematophila str. Websteri]AYA39668.1 aminotransferase class I/II-fold pyridoxal phosphate-dependent enzyme [Xenorhabdus nematophila]KHD29721.1 aminotransferase [Xenorhabdus nematophila]MBA0018237.1 aminotransferase class I/II-fold pyridoxal phosphate-dependent enzyme [Xenorhabdus nematophila]MCB4424321.1 aminotransferase class I/II-fold pyridoxal p
MIIDCVYKALRNKSEVENSLKILADADLLSGDSSVVKQYEEKLRKYFKTKHAIAVSSGTAALHASLMNVINPGDEVLVPAICVPMTVSAILQARGIPVFYDCKEGSFIPDISCLTRRLTSSSKVLITVSMWGYRAIDSEIVGFCKENNIVIIEDAAQSAGTYSSLGYEGTVGDIGCFSTHEFKLISTGEGGFVLTNSDSYAEKIRSYTHIGFNQSCSSFGYADGLNYKLSSFQAAIGISQLDNLDLKIKNREKTINVWDSLLLNKCDTIKAMPMPDVIRHNGYSLCCLLDKNQLFSGKYLASKLYLSGINTDTFRYKNTIVSNYPLYNDFYKPPFYYGINEKDFPNAVALVQRMIVFPCHERITEGAIYQAAIEILKVLRSM